MEINSTSITITDENIVSYYNENPHINIVIMNHIFIISKTFCNTSRKISSRRIIIIIIQIIICISSPRGRASPRPQRVIKIGHST